ncbi:muts domain V-domain-containing protein [Phytophthora cinnamomi]|nr:muts domain V-domain-containing protein [Phytophthora cinnamomi]
MSGASELTSSTSPLLELRTQIRQCELQVAAAVKQAAALLSIAEDRIKVIYADEEQSNVTRMGIVLRVSRQDSHRIQQQSGKLTFLLLDGGQKSGQASLLQLLGIVVILNQIGCFVPCQDAVLPVFDAIYLRTGAYDQQLYGYSTFMTEMREMSHIFSTMTPTSLVLIEDLCRGTSTSEGLALALSMCLHLMESKTLTCFSSQWRELTDHLADQPLTATPMLSESSCTDNPTFDGGFHMSPQGFIEIEQLMRNCDLPADLIARIEEELRQQGT